MQAGGRNEEEEDLGELELEDDTAAEAEDAAEALARSASALSRGCVLTKQFFPRHSRMP